MDIPVMPHPGTDAQASPYQSRQTKEPVPIVRRLSTLSQKRSLRLRLEELNAREIANSFAFPLAKAIFELTLENRLRLSNWSELHCVRLARSLTY